MYTGKQVPEGYKSLAYSLVFRSEEGTLTDADITEPVNAIVKASKKSSAASCADVNKDAVASEYDNGRRNRKLGNKRTLHQASFILIYCKKK